MPITVRVHGDERPRPGAPGQGAMGCVITLDAPRILLGRGEGSEVRLPDPSVSHRHVTVRQRGNDYVLVDEGSTNGTRVGKVLLTAHAPHTLAPHELIRVGKVWVELTVGSDPPTRQAPKVAKEIALALVMRSLEQGGEDGRPRVRVDEGASAGTEAPVEDGESLVVGRARDVGLTIEDPDASRRHVEIKQRGDVLVVKDLGSKSGTMLGDRSVGDADVVWKRGEPLRVGSTSLSYEFEAADALAEIERLPDAKVPARDLVIGDEVEDFSYMDEPIDDDVEEPAEESEEISSAALSQHRLAAETAAREAQRASWSITDFAVVLLAMGVFSLSAVGYWVLLR